MSNATTTLWNGKEQVSGTAESKELTQAEYDAIPESTKNSNDVTYYIKDAVAESQLSVGKIMRNGTEYSSADASVVKSHLTASDNTEFKFGVTDDGRYGYTIKKDGADTVIPFSSEQVLRITLYGLSGHMNLENKGNVSLLLKTFPYSSTFHVNVYGTNSPDVLNHSSSSEVTLIGSFIMNKNNIDNLQSIQVSLTDYRYIVLYPVYQTGWSSGSGCISEIRTY